MGITISDIKTFRNVIEATGKVVDEGNFVVSSEGMKLTAPDRQMVNVVSLNILPTFFDELNVEGESTMGLNIDHLIEVLKRAKDEDKIRLSWDKTNLKIEMRGAINRGFKLPLLEVTQEKPPIDTLNWDEGAMASICTKDLKEILKDAETTNDAVRITIEPDNGICFTAKGDVREMETLIKKEDKSLIKIDGKAKASSQFKVEELQKLVHINGETKSVTLYVANDYPMKVRYTLIDRLTLEFITAPRVEY